MLPFPPLLLSTLLLKLQLLQLKTLRPLLQPLLQLKLLLQPPLLQPLLLLQQKLLLQLLPLRQQKLKKRKT